MFAKHIFIHLGFKLINIFKLIFFVTVSITLSLNSFSKPVSREDILATNLLSSKIVSSIRGQEIELPENTTPGAHTHPCPVIGYILEGTVIYQIKGGVAKTLNAGDSFYEPENTIISRFESQDKPVKFIAYYLMQDDNKPLVKMVN